MSALEDPRTVAVLDQRHAEMSEELDGLVRSARVVVAEHGPEYGALVIGGHLQLDEVWTAEMLAGMLGMALARLAGEQS